VIRAGDEQGHDEDGIIANEISQQEKGDLCF
jgi:hypothetical protein